jgi:hypothetical protein
MLVAISILTGEHFSFPVLMMVQLQHCWENSCCLSLREEILSFQSTQGKSVRLVHVIRVEFDLYCSPYKLVHAPAFPGQDIGIIEHDPMVEVNAVFCHN